MVGEKADCDVPGIVLSAFCSIQFSKQLYEVGAMIIPL
jgi:hypothetical protein